MACCACGQIWPDPHARPLTSSDTVQALQELPLQRNSSTMLTDIRVLHLQCKRAKVNIVGPCIYCLADLIL